MCLNGLISTLLLDFTQRGQNAVRRIRLHDDKVSAYGILNRASDKAGICVRMRHTGRAVSAAAAAGLNRDIVHRRLIQSGRDLIVVHIAVEENTCIRIPDHFLAKSAA